MLDANLQAFKKKFHSFLNFILSFKIKPLARLTKKKREKTQINRIRNEKEKYQLTLQKYKGS